MAFVPADYQRLYGHPLGFGMLLKEFQTFCPDSGPKFHIFTRFKTVTK